MVKSERIWWVPVLTGSGVKLALSLSHCGLIGPKEWNKCERADLHFKKKKKVQARNEWFNILPKILASKEKATISGCSICGRYCESNARSKLWYHCPFWDRTLGTHTKGQISAASLVANGRNYLNLKCQKYLQTSCLVMMYIDLFILWERHTKQQAQTVHCSDITHMASLVKTFF